MKSVASNTATATGEGPELGRRSILERVFVDLFGQIRMGSVTVIFPSARRQRFDGTLPGPRAVIQINDVRLAYRVLLSGGLGFAEGYVEGEWETPDLTSVLKLGALNAEMLSGALKPSIITTLLNRYRHARRANTRKGSRRNISAHYDLGNAFFAQWLDETMSYSSAMFEDMAEPHATAQRRKYRRLAGTVGLQPGDRVLEIGCGWGGFAELAAKEFGCEVVGLTLSKEQAAYARNRMERAGLADRADIRLQDYRDVRGEFDKVVAIEMFEAVGEENWGVFFDTLSRLLKPGGRAGLQVITIADSCFDAYRCNPEFIQKYIFPGGMLPSPSAFERAASKSGLTISDRFFFGKSYAESLRRWDRAFRDNWPTIKCMGFDERFYRLWRYYLSYCETGFELGRIDVGQFVIDYS